MPRSIVRTAIPIAVVLVAALVVESAMAETSTTVAGKSVAAVRVVRDASVSGLGSTSFEDLPGASTTITVPAKTKALILVRFSAESLCLGPVDSQAVCSVRVLVGNAEADPASGSDFAFDSSNAGREGAFSWESHSMDRSRGPLGPGTYTVKVQCMVTTVGGTFSLDDWSLTVERVTV
ncbi:MAG: hypothetical protein AB1551_08800 [Actinomycetota bacterium]